MIDLSNESDIGLTLAFATGAHMAVGQRRKYTGEEYITHPVEVANILNENINVDINVLQAAILHDVVEDTAVTIRNISTLFNSRVAILVDEVTDKFSDRSLGNRAHRKELERERLANISKMGQNIKVADMISNTKDIVTYDLKFAKVYLEEKSKLLDVLTKADQRIVKIARVQIEDGFKRIQEQDGWN